MPGDHRRWRLRRCRLLWRHRGNGDVASRLGKALDMCHERGDISVRRWHAQSCVEQVQQALLLP